MTNKEYSDFLIPDVLHDYDYYLKKYPKRKLKEGAMVTRFAPSPTGFLHMGSLYTSFATIQMAKQSGGVSFLRIEDTDQKRIVENGITGLINDFKKLNIEFDEDPIKGGNYGPYVQSERFDIYKAFIKKLIEDGSAYPCFMSKEELDSIRLNQEHSKKRIGIYGKYARCRDLERNTVIEKIKNGENFIIRLKSNGDFDNKIVLHDLIKGDIEMPQNDQDVVILKNDGLPTYHFAHAVDDYLMGTTHVIRGDEWVSSYPIHEELFRRLEFDLPNFCHISPITIKEGNTIRKISKRKDKEAAISYYNELGIPTEVIWLYLAAINNYDFESWYNENSDKSIDDFEFKFEHMPVGGSLFDFEKIRSISKIYFSRLKATALYDNLVKYTQEYDKEFNELIIKYKDYTINILNIEREVDRPRKDIDSYSCIKNEINYMYDELFNPEYKNKEYYSIEFLEDYINNYYNENDDKETWFNKIKELAPKYGYCSNNKEYKLNPDKYKGNISHACEIIRVSVTGREQTPDLYEILKLLGKEKIKNRIENFKR